MTKASTTKPSVAFEWELWRAHIEGTTPLMQKRMANEMLDDNDTKAAKKKHRLPREAAEEACYRDSQGKIVHPASAVVNLLCAAGRNHKDKATRRGLHNVVPAGVQPDPSSPDYIPICDLEGKRLSDFEVDSRTGVNWNCRPPARVLVHRPRYDSWSSGFVLRINVGVIEPSMVHQLLVEGGVLVGLGAFRPEKKGSFGTFGVALWENVPDSAVATRKRTLATANGG